MAWLLGCALWLSAWLVPVLGQAWVQWRPLCEAVNSDRSALLSSFNLYTFGTRPTGQSAAWCARVETRACGRGATGVVWEAVEAEGVVCSRRLDSARPRSFSARAALFGLFEFSISWV